MKKVKKLIIPAAGWGTRFLPFTKIVHKELLPILNKPAISYLIDEALESGIEEIFIVLAERKYEIYEYFKKNVELEKELKQKKKLDLLDEVKKTNLYKNIHVVYQDKQNGLGDAIASAIKFEDVQEPYAVILGDDLIYSETPAIKQLMDLYEKTGSTIIGVQDVELKNTKKYGVVQPLNPNEKDLDYFKIIAGIEKPEPEKAPSTKAIMGRYVFTPEFMNELKKQEFKGEEIQVVDAFDEILKKQDIYALTIKGIRYDLGNPNGFVKANIDYALRSDDHELSEEISNFIKLKK
ncbi:UTP--glucose-1-phosphate uridylyltransferase [Mycoplasma elephantis]|uniref:UTP--glucose-1-phosphate uridylyltransferase n=1 Tax=Mycoplasma elephantis TaxID=114882 RepID=UPI000AC47610